MNISKQLDYLYLANASVLIAHEIDSAYWREWEMFHVPGGIQFFVLLHLLLLPLVMLGYREVAAGRYYAKHVTVALACVGLFAAGVHGAFILAGDMAFTLPVSKLILLVTFILSALQLFTVWALGKKGAARRAQ